MCALYTLRISPEELVSSLPNLISPANFPSELMAPVDFHWRDRILPYQRAPVILKREQNFQLRMMNFSLVPAWSKEPKVKFATHNARLETLAEKPTWKRPLVKNHCLIPMSGFVEPIYENALAGNMVMFEEQHDQVMFAAGIWDEWINQTTGEVLDSFSIITHDPPPFVAQVGHDRCPLFLKKDRFLEWLENPKKEAPQWVSFLKASEVDLEFKTRIERPLRPGWEKRK